MKRRRFLQSTAVAVFALQAVPRQGGGVLNDLKGEGIVALCDGDGAEAAGTFNAFPRAARFKDYRAGFGIQG